ncbi:MAG: hypothetical protein N3F63_00225 [Thermoplasmata archaeon]|nr:hypothetical protein [Thermoplasmata archaeon]
MVRNKAAMGVGIAGGVCLLLAGVGGVAYLGTVRDIILQVINNEAIALIFSILIAIAALGGIAVIIGAVLIGIEHPKIGKLFVWLGTGLGIISLIFGIISISGEMSAVTIGPTTLAIVGTVLAMVCKYLAK